jgi:alpha-tubulin suppressor-like RCC1 family protein
MGDDFGVALSKSGQIFFWDTAPTDKRTSYKVGTPQATAVAMTGWPPDLHATAVACGHQHSLVIGVDR